MESADANSLAPPEPSDAHPLPSPGKTSSPHGPIDRALLDSLEDGYFETDLAGRFVVFNRALSELLGYPTEELKDLSYRQYTDAETAQRVFQAFNQVYRTGEPLRKLGFELVHKDGACRSVEVSVSLIRGPDHQPRGFRGVLRDVSERKQAEEAVARERNLLRTVIDLLPEQIYVKDLQCRFLICNPAVARKAGALSEADMIGKTDFDFSPPELAELYFADEQAILRSGQALINREEPIADVQTGGVRWNLSSKVPLYDSAGQVIGLAGVNHDITDRKQAERDVADALRYSQTILDTSPLGIITYRASGEAVAANPASAHLINASVEQVKAQNFRQLESWRRSGMLAAADEALASQAQRDLEVHSTSTFGKEFWLQCRFVPFTHADEPHLLALFEDISERKHAKHELERRADEFAALYETARALATERDVPALLRATVEQAMGLLAVPNCNIFLYDRSAGDLVLTVAKGSKVQPGLRLKLGEGMAGRVAQTREPLLVDDYRTWEHRSPQFTPSEFGAIVHVPMLFAGELIGVLSVADLWGAKRTFSEADARLLTLLAGQAASAVHNARLLEESRRRADQLQAVNDVERATSAVLEPEPLLSHISQVIRTRLNLYSVVIGLIEGSELVFNAGSRADARGTDRPDIRLRIGQEGITGWAAATGRTVLVPDVSLDPRFVPSAYLPNTRSELAAPLRTSAGIVGVLNMESDEVNAFTPELVGLVETLALQIASAIEKARLFAETRRLARTDALTGIPNRRYLFELGEHEVSRARRFAHPLAALMLDIDHFKRVNDAYGHAQGDQVLQVFVQCCLQQIRDIDILGRYGGEEFVILLVETGVDGARSLAERIRGSVAQIAVPTAQDSIRITASVGIAQLRETGEDLDGLLGRADHALYAAKQAGRNRVEVR